MFKTIRLQVIGGLLILAMLSLGIAFALRESRVQALQSVKAPDAITLTELQEKTPAPKSTPSGVPTPLPDTLNLEMPFFTQAPTGNWDYPWQEACEEASSTLVANAYQNLKLDANGFNEQLLKLVDWENTNFGTYQDTTLAQTAEIIKANYGLESVLHQNLSFEDIEKILNQGHFLIAPFSGKLLGNPNFKNGGPLYHNLVIKGYDATKMQIVTNDVGTRNGADYVYTWAVLQNALHDWNATDITLGTKSMLEVLPPTP